MSELDALTGGKYIFFQSIANNKVLSSRISSISVKIGGGSGGSGMSMIKKSKNYSQFAHFMTSYLSKLQRIATVMRNAELNFINKSI